MEQSHTLEIAYILIRLTILLVVVITGQELYFELRERQQTRKPTGDSPNKQE